MCDHIVCRNECGSMGEVAQGLKSVVINKLILEKCDRMAEFGAKINLSAIK